jgi:eukaryotic-like serine/threonine-protein kinase
MRELPQGDWARTDELFAGALDLPEPERADFVEKGCAGDEALRARVQRLLAAAEEDDGPLGDPGVVLAGPLQELFGSSADPEIGARHGAYRIVEVLGRGGGGTVYLAVREDGAYDHTVAIKILRRGAVADDLLRRFHAERQILASLNHPCIARLLDGGATSDGWPYMVMEHVEGLPITDHCDRLRMPVAERLRLFVDVARAVGHAHRSLVVHRDLKPSNILIAADGTPRLLDFGIAKLLASGDGLQPTETLTTGLLTPAYASPEQLRGEQITTATDIYQLGVLLHVLLTGRRPFTADDVVSRLATLDEDPDVPSAAVGRGHDVAERALQRRSDPRALRREVHGDLDTIVSKCLRHEPSARYVTPDALADDVERYLSHRPVLARAPTLRYRTARLVRRRPGAVAAALLAVAGVLLYVGSLQSYTARLQKERDRADASSAYARGQQSTAEAALAATEQARARAAAAQRHADEQRRAAERAARQATAEAARAEAERDRAVRQERRAEAVTQFAVGLFRPPPELDVRPDTLSAAGLLAIAAQRVREEVRDDPNTRGTLLRTIGGAYAALGAGLPATQLLEEAVRVYEEAHGVLDDRTISALEGLAAHRRRSFHHEDARVAYEQALDLRRRQPRRNTAAIAANLRGLALTMRDLGRADTALVLLGESLALRTSASDVAALDSLLEGRDDASVASDYAALGFLLRGTGDIAGAERAYVEAIQRMRSNEDAYRDELHGVLNNYAFLLRSSGRLEEAEPLYRESLRRVVAREGEHSAAARMVRSNTVALLQAMGRFEEAEPLVRENLAGDLAQFGPESWQAGRGHLQLAGHMLASGRPAEGEADAREALRLYSAELGPAHTWTASAHRWLSQILAELGRRDEAEDQLLAALRIAEAPTDRRNEDLVRSYRELLARFYEEGGRPDLARRYRD